MIRLLSVAILLLAFSSCSKRGSPSTEVIKPKYHKGWYKNHRWHRKIQVGRVRLKPFEKQGTTKVKMK